MISFNYLHNKIILSKLLLILLIKHYKLKLLVSLLINLPNYNKNIENIKTKK